MQVAVLQVVALLQVVQEPPVIGMAEQSRLSVDGDDGGVVDGSGEVDGLGSLPEPEPEPEPEVVTGADGVGGVGGGGVGVDAVVSAAQMPPCWSKKKPSLQVAAVHSFASHMSQVPS